MNIDPLQIGTYNDYFSSLELRMSVLEKQVAILLEREKSVREAESSAELSLAENGAL